MKKTCIISLLLLWGTLAQAQNLATANFDFPGKPTVGPIDTTFQAVILEDRVVYEFFYNPKKGDNLDVLKTVYRRVQVHTDKGVNRYNKLSFSLADGNSLVNIKARTTNAQGKETAFARKNLREVDSEEGRYLSFPIDGVQHGDVIEYYYQMAGNPPYWDRIYFQFDVPVDTFSFEIIAPKNLKYETRTYNVELLAQDTSIDEKNYVRLGKGKIPALLEEPYMYVKPTQGRLDFKLAFNSARGSNRLFTWGDAGSRIYENVYALEKADLAAIKKYTKSLKITGKTNEEKVKQLELKIKTQIDVQRGAPSDPAFAIKNKVTSSTGITRVFTGVLNELGIEHELVLTSPRNRFKFDKDFDHWSYLDEYLIYFPETGKYLMPDEFNYRYPYFNPYLSATYGLFITPVEVGGSRTGLGKVRYIPTFKPHQSNDDLKINIRLEPDADQAVLQITRLVGGLNAANYVPYLGLMPAGKAEEFCTDLLKSGIDDARVKLNPIKKEMTAAGFDEAFVLSGELRSQELLELAGNRLVFNIGQSIGNQTQLYQEFERKFPVENSYNRRYNREITMDIPAGYKLLNPEALRFNVRHERDGKLISVFESNFKLDGNKLLINIEEYYTEVWLPREEFDAFKAVINAAADFNKVKLILEQQ